MSTAASTGGASETSSWSGRDASEASTFVASLSREGVQFQRRLPWLLIAAGILGAFWPGPRYANKDVTFVLTGVALAVLAWASLAPHSQRAASALRSLLTPALALTFGLYITIGMTARDAIGDPLWRGCLGTAGVLVGLGLIRDPRVERWRIPMLLALHAVMSLWKIRVDRTPDIDVWVWHREALDALLHGQNPFAMTMPNIYRHTRYYDPSMVVNGRVLSGFQYPPLSLLFALPGHLLGDYRYSMLAAMTVTGACLAYARPGPFSSTAMALWLFSPANLYILDRGFTETMVVMLLALTLYCSVRRPSLTYLPLGLLFAGKQYMFGFAGALVWLLPEAGNSLRSFVRFLVPPVLIAAAVNLPFFAINPKAFIDSVFLFQVRQPFRKDSLSLLAWSLNHYGWRPPDWTGFASLIPTTVASLWRLERSASAFSLALAVVSFAFFFLSKQAFCNYYYFTLGAICCAIAFAEPEAAAA